MNGPEIWFSNSCAILWRVPVSPYGQKEVTVTNDSPVTLKITRIEYSKGDGTPPHQVEFCHHALPLFISPGSSLTVVSR